MENQKSPDSLPQKPEDKDIVKDIFNRPNPRRRPISAIFTYYKKTPKVRPASVFKEIPANIKLLPVALDIGSTRVKAVCLGENDKGVLEIIRMDREVYGPPSAGSDQIQAVKNALINIARRNRLSVQCTVNISANDVMIYDMAFPSMPEEELRLAIQYKVSQQKPFGLGKDDITFRYKKWEVIKGIPDASQQRIIAACVPNASIVKRISLLADAGFDPVSIEIPQFSMVNLGGFYKKEAREEGPILYVHIGAEESFIVIEKDRTPVFVRKTAITSKQMTKAISKQYSVPEDEAEKLKTEYGFKSWSEGLEGLTAQPSDKSKLTYRALASLLESLVIDIEHAFKYFSFQLTQSQITKFGKVILSGGGSNLKELDRFLSVKLGVPVDRFNPFNFFRVCDSMGGHKDVLSKDLAGFAVCTALSLGGKLDESARASFIPEKEKGIFNAINEFLKYPLVKAGVVVIVAAIALLGKDIWRAGYYKSRIDFLTTEFKRARIDSSHSEERQVTLVKEEADLIGKAELLRAQLALLKGGVRDRIDFSSVLSSLGSLLPQEIWVNELKYTEDNFVLKCSAIDVTMILRLVEDLRTTREFKNAHFKYTQKDALSNMFTFEITAEIDT
ncbi:MAG: pilus assembly protein PilM [Candidatus Omnitrophota bacterium]